jgi:PAS domain S-box-containing protein
VQEYGTFPVRISGGEVMKDAEKTKKQLIDELMELRSQNTALKKSTGVSISTGLVIEEARRYAESIVETVRGPLLVLDADLKIIFANHNFFTTFKVNPDETIGSFIYDLGNKQWNIPKLRELLEDILPKKEAFDNFEVAHKFKDIGQKIMLLNARQIYRKDINSKIILLAIEDITERRLSGEKLLLAAIVESSKDAIIGKSLDGIITSWNKGAEEIYGYTKSEIIGKSISVLIPPELPDEMAEILRKIKLGEGIENYETVRQRKDGQDIDVSITVSGVYDAEGRILGASTIERDITERKQMEKRLSDSEEQYRLLFETANDGIVLIEKNKGKIAHINPAVEKMLGYSAKESIGNKLQDVGLIIDNGDFQITMKNLNERGILRYNDVPVKTKSGHHIYADTYLVDKAKFAQCNIRDITERKKAEEVLRKSEGRLREVLENSQEVSYKINLQTNHYEYLSPVIVKISGYAKDEIEPLPFETIMMNFIHPDDHAEIGRVIAESTSGAVGTGYQMNYRFKHKNGQYHWCQDRFTVMRDAGGHPLAIIGNVSDISERKQADEKLLESKTLFEAVVENIPLMIFLKEATDLRFVIFNRAGEELLGHDRKDLLGKNNLDLFPTEQAAHFMAKDREVLDGKAIVLDIPEEQIQTAKKGQRLLHTKKVCIRSSDGTTKYLLGISEDITERKQAEEELQQTLESLRKAVGTTVQVMVSAVESRDPYTSGHQLRSANLARAIATEMGLSPDKIEGIRMAGSIHDIGKLSIPAEILSKPTKLSDIEFSLIKEHSQKGYEMLKDVESPWPLAQIVYQHHERMDGSGYPRNKKGEEILMEARILAVADVVEAMASHRPYRPSLGINAALAEIEKNKGTFYDNTVVDACLRLFREKGFKLEVA